MSDPMIPNIFSGNLKNFEQINKRNDREALKSAAKEMETLFAYEMIKAMRKTTENSSKNSLGGDIYTSLFDMEIAKLCAEKGLGIKEMLLKNLDRENAELKKNSQKSDNIIKPSEGGSDEDIQ